ncbi:MAG TPA: substrate-binding domain-containing protein [Pirellulales bacterium]|nr:substrate-binding domain-containing protein [Pirellulales bacterium]
MIHPLRTFAWLVLLAFSCLTLGCTKQGDDATAGKPAGKAKYRLAVIPKGTTHEFWKSVHYGAVQAADELGAEILWLGPLLEQDRAGQIDVVQNFITKRVDGIILAPIDSQALVAPVDQAHEEGIPVVIFDSGLDEERLADPAAVVSYVATDNERGGELAADEISRRLPNGGRVVLLRYMVGSQSTFERETGFLKGLEKHPKLTLLSSDQYSGDTPQSALDKAQQVLDKDGDQIDALFAVCEPNTAGTLRALEESGRAGKIVFIGFDPNQRIVQALADNKVQGLVLQDPVRMGYLATKAMIEHLNGQQVEQRINTGEVVATPENMNDPAIKPLLAPIQFQD